MYQNVNYLNNYFFYLKLISFLLSHYLSICNKDKVLIVISLSDEFL
ncbi:hypothetical protein PROPEN_01515 [Proteus penneri ATCC 35198]|nr:hypothetical protein PROPEN_01515 [Proteus penneri ATCC 35198]